jgi:hypothetical protein
MDLNNIVLSEISHKKTNTALFIPLESQKWKVEWWLPGAGGGWNLKGTGFQFLQDEKFYSSIAGQGICSHHFCAIHLKTAKG